MTIKSFLHETRICGQQYDKVATDRTITVDRTPSGKFHYIQTVEDIAVGTGFS